MSTGVSPEEPSRARWTIDEASEWRANQPWRVGCNFIPSSAINQLEMWQPGSFDIQTIDRELVWASHTGFNAVRVFLHDLLWQEGAPAFLARIERFLDVAVGHNIATMLVLFDGVWDPFPKSGVQRPAKPHVHNSGWVQSPGAEVLADPSRHEALAPYVTGILGHFRDDSRILAWDLFNEPDNPNIRTYGEREPENKAELAEQLLRKTFSWAREAGPSQPLTAGIWRGRVTGNGVSSINRLMLEESDVLSFHSYLDSNRVAKRIDELSTHGRPILLTEFMSRGSGSSFETILPLARQRGVGAFCWGLVSGKTQTIYPWDSWVRTYPEPETWFHDVLRPDGTPYRVDEVRLIRRLAGTAPEEN